MQSKLKKSLSVLLSLLMVLSLLGGFAVSSGAEDGKKTLTVIANPQMKDRGQADPPGIITGQFSVHPVQRLENQPGGAGGSEQVHRVFRLLRPAFRRVSGQVQIRSARQAGQRLMR